MIRPVIVSSLQQRKKRYPTSKLMLRHYELVDTGAPDNAFYRVDVF